MFETANRCVPALNTLMASIEQYAKSIDLKSLDEDKRAQAKIALASIQDIAREARSALDCGSLLPLSGGSPAAGH